MKKTALYDIHLNLGAKMVNFANYLMPLVYKGAIEEHINVRTKVGVFDVSHMGEIWVKGKGAYDLLQYLTCNDIKKLTNGKAQYSCIINEKGGIVDDLIIYKFDDENYLLVVNAINTDKVFNWLTKNNKFEAKIINSSEEITQLAIQGPLALNVCQLLTNENLSNLSYYTFKILEFAGIKDVIFSITGYTGAGGCEIYFPNQYAKTIWNNLFDVGKDFSIMPIGLAARDTLRLEMGYCLYGNDINENTTPIEANLTWITKFEVYKNFIAKDILLSQKEKGTEKKLVGFIMENEGIPRQSYKIYNDKLEEIGWVTSGSFSPILKKGIGLGYVKTVFSMPNTPIKINIRNSFLPAKIVKPPFIKKNS